MAKTTAKTTVQFKGVTYPFYRTIRGVWDFEQAGFLINDMASGKLSAQYAYLYFQLRDCARRSGNEFKISLSDFVDQADGEELLEAFTRLHELEQKGKDAEGGEPGKPEPTPEQAPS